MHIHVPVRRAIVDRLVSIASLLVLVLAVVALDDRVREKASLLLSRDGAVTALEALTWRAGELMRVASRFVHDQGMENAALVIFGVAALTLVGFMLRT
jgi:hypothetical protein